jgi:hypothetical protein
MSLLNLISNCLVFNVPVLGSVSGLYNLELAVSYVTEYCKRVREDCHSNASDCFCFWRPNICQVNRFSKIMYFIGTNLI